MLLAELGRGFLPTFDPATSLPAKFSLLDQLKAELPSALQNHTLRPTLENLHTIDCSKLEGAELARAFAIYGFLASGYIHALGEVPVNKIPQGVAVPLYEISQKMGQPPILSYRSYVLDNWRRQDPDGSIELENLHTLMTFTDLPDEKWFILVHTEIESEAVTALGSLKPAQEAARNENPDVLENCLVRIEQSTKQMVNTLLRMEEGTSTDVFYSQFRPYIFLFDDVFYEGVEAFKGQQQSFRGETGAQSSIMPSLDGALGIQHQQTGMTDHISAMREYMPPAHRAFIEEVGQVSPIRPFIERSRNPRMIDIYNGCLTNMADFRGQHLVWATKYIQQKVTDPRGTGGTPFMRWLGQLCEETLNARF